MARELHHVTVAGNLAHRKVLIAVRSEDGEIALPPDDARELARMLNEAADRVEAGSSN